MLDDLVVGSHDHPRISGNLRRGWGAVALGAGCVAFAGLCLKASGELNASPAWTLAAVLAVLLAFGALALGIADLRRSVQMGFDGRCRNRRIRDASLRWHPSHAQVLDEFRRTMEPRGSTKTRAITEAVSGRAAARLMFDGAPFRVGSRAAMWFGAAASRAAFALDSFEFRLSCAREAPSRVLRWNTPLTRLADLEPVVCRFDKAKAALRVEFDLPPGLPGADLLADEPVYWELTVVINDDAGRYAERFFVPVSS